MGAFTLTINGVDRTSALDQQSIVIREHLRGRGSTAEFRYRTIGGSPAAPEGGNEVVISNGATREFAGRLLVPSFEMTRDPATRVPAIEFTCYCADYTYDLDRFLVFDRDSGSSKVYVSQGAGAIVTDLINVYTDGSFGTGGIETGLTAQQQEFDVVPVSECIDKVSRETGYIWRVDYSKVVNFFVLEKSIAPIDRIDLDGESRIYDLTGELGDAAQVKNSLYFKDVPLAAETPISEYFTGNGVSKFFPLSYPPSPRTGDVTISAGGVGWVTRFDDQSGYTPVDNRSGTGTAFLCVFNRGLRTESAFTAGTVFTANYKRLTPMLAHKVDGASIAEMARREGLTGRPGIHEHVIALPHLIGADQNVVEARMDIVLLQYAWPRIRFQFKSKVEGWAVSQYAQVFSSAFNVNRRMYVQEVEKHVLDGQAGTWEYTVTLLDQLHGDD